MLNSLTSCRSTKINTTSHICHFAAGFFLRNHASWKYHLQIVVSCQGHQLHKQLLVQLTSIVFRCQWCHVTTETSIQNASHSTLLPEYIVCILFSHSIYNLSQPSTLKRTLRETIYEQLAVSYDTRTPQVSEPCHHSTWSRRCGLRLPYGSLSIASIQSGGGQIVTTWSGWLSDQTSHQSEGSSFVAACVPNFPSLTYLCHDLW